MAEFTQDWCSQHHANWQRWFGHLAGQPGLRILEIGSYEGRSARWWLDNLATDESSWLWCIDTWDGSPEHGDVGDLYERFMANVGHHVRVHPKRADSLLALASMQEAWGEAFDLIYLDGSHDAPDVLSDAVLAWPLVKPGGYLLFDDYPWQYRLPDGRLIGPRAAVDAFVACYRHELEVVAAGWQVLVRKR